MKKIEKMFQVGGKISGRSGYRKHNIFFATPNTFHPIKYLIRIYFWRLDCTFDSGRLLFAQTSIGFGTHCGCQIVVDSHKIEY
jgi:hypothetical protein